jgi:KaiC/GvpD/RAD55 family RecA-like ATPase
MGKAPGSGIRDLREGKPRPIPASPPSVRPITEVDNGRVRALEDREKEIRETADALEAESRELEEAAREVERERQALKTAKERVIEREHELDAKAIILEDLILAGRNGFSAGEVGTDSMSAAPKQLASVLEEERSRIRREVERDMAEQLTRIGQLEAELKAVQVAAREAEEPLTPIDLNEVLTAVTSELREQIGTGLADGLEDRRVTTHVERLDQILSGGVPTGHVILINGPPGSMKTSLTYNVLHNSAIKAGRKGLFLSLEQDTASLLRQMDRLGMRRKDSVDDLMVVDLVDLRRSMEGHIGDWHNIITRYIENSVKERPIELLAIDSLESFLAMSEHEFTRTDVQDLFDRFRSLGLTTFVISETPMGRLESGRRMELYVADGAIELEMRETPDAHVQRILRCVKMRGANIDTRSFCLMHAGGSFILNLPMTRASAH